MTTHTSRIVITLATLFGLIGCTTTTNTTNTAQKTTWIAPVSGAKIPHKVLKNFKNGLQIRNGGFGSAATAHPVNTREFYAMTDRGPNVAHPKGKMFPVAIYSPTIGHFKLDATGKVSVVKTINLKRPNGKPITGLPNPQGYGATGERAFDIKNKALPFDPYGLDPEGLVATPSGEFWVSDEYGPHIIRFNANGRELERISPVGLKTSGRRLPAVFAKRRPNRGMEGLAITPDGRTLVGIMQSTLYNPSKSAIKNKNLTRIVTFDLATGQTKQYLYRQDRNNLSNSEIVALSNREFLVLERDGKMHGGGKPVQKRVYRISLDGATDVSADINAPTGRLINGKTLEQLSWAELEKAGIRAVRKSLAVDLVNAVGYPHDKAEGFWLINARQLGIINDDDFAITLKNGKAVQKTLANGQQDAGRIYIVNFQP